MPHNSTTMHSPLVISGLVKRYGKVEVLRQLDLSVAAGAVHGLVGLNGSGKTTTLECLLGMQPFHAGEVRVLGLSPENLHRSHGDIVGIFDSPSLHPQLTVRQVLDHARLLCAESFGARQSSRPAPRTPEEVEAMLGISRYSHYRIRQLSLGNRRRASIAQGLIGRPRLVVLDEPFNGLDAGGVDDVLALISQLNREEGTTFLLSSHQLPYLERICSHISILHQGRIIISDSIGRLFDSNQQRLLVHCDDVVRACAIVQGLTGVTIEDSVPRLLTLHLHGVSPSLINRLLVEKGIAVEELVRERHSLNTLFRDVTQAPALSEAS